MRSAVGSAYRLGEVERSDRTLTATVDFDASSPLFAGHYPDLAVVPGVLLIDLSRRVAVEHFADLLGGGRPQIHSAQFSAPVYPGTPVTLHAEVGAGSEVRVRLLDDEQKLASIRLRDNSVRPIFTPPPLTAVVGAPMEPRLPHRPPMAFLDEVVAVSPERLHARAGRSSIDFHRDTTTFVSPDPATVWPPALVLEAWCQAAAVLMMRLAPEFATTVPAVLISRLTAVRSLADAALGDTIDLHVRLLERYPTASTLTGCARVGERVVLEIDRLTATLRPFDRLRSPSA
ncbi:hypothetical protein [Nocardia terpenica]|uniref:ApeI dehydratase-like domain-containing protein n=1 Tax=Nocardia terpenica TaxID=455432 RepID=A0A6G9Z515_9NOCA|nr:hypothetical protein [Nocardia terpenica]QIS20695.1 hypothetical protein F6W96_22680 [Nocardia terpenica]